jgi:pyruvate/2-oxoglutarate dehydrogenase complex dihydrolipoamide acyltransferase (E2) component
VVVCHDADKKNLLELSKEIAKLAEEARQSRIALENVRGATFTVSNVGMLGVVMNTPIVNPPESAILGVGMVSKKPAVVNGRIVIRSMMYLCLTYDHRIIDGLPAIQFLQSVKQSLENPELLIDFQ